MDEWTRLTYAKNIAQTSKQGDFPHGEKNQDGVLSLPIYPEITGKKTAAAFKDGLIKLCGASWL